MKGIKKKTKLEAAINSSVETVNTVKKILEITPNMRAVVIKRPPRIDSEEKSELSKLLFRPRRGGCPGPGGPGRENTGGGAHRQGGEEVRGGVGVWGRRRPSLQCRGWEEGIHGQREAHPGEPLV